jgi:REP element-mobilizing transposase RayT
MARQWRIEYPGALYHVLSRGNGRRDIFLSNKDRHHFLSILEELSERFDIEVFAYVLIGNHYHILLKTLFSHACFCHRSERHVVEQTEEDEPDKRTRWTGIV